MIPSVIAFLFFWIYAAIALTKHKEFSTDLPQIIENTKKMPKILRGFFLILFFVFLGFAVTGFLITMGYGGYATICEDGFCIVNHGVTVGFIQEFEYLILVVFDRFSWSAMLLAFLSMWVAHSYDAFKAGQSINNTSKNPIDSVGAGE